VAADWQESEPGAGACSVGSTSARPDGFRRLAAQAKPGAGYLLGCGVWQEILGFTPM